MKYIKVDGCKSCPFLTYQYYREHFMWAKCNHPNYWKEFEWEQSYKELDEDELNSYGKECPLDDKLKE